MGNVGKRGCAHPAGEVLLGDLYRSGFEVVMEHEDADAIIVNTCGFVEDAKTESLEVWEWVLLSEHWGKRNSTTAGLRTALAVQRGSVVQNAV